MDIFCHIDYLFLPWSAMIWWIRWGWLKITNNSAAGRIRLLHFFPISLVFCDTDCHTTLTAIQWPQGYNENGYQGRCYPSWCLQFLQWESHGGWYLPIIYCKSVLNKAFSNLKVLFNDITWYSNQHLHLSESYFITPL